MAQCVSSAHLPPTTDPGVCHRWRTLESMRELGETIVAAGDEEIAGEEAMDEYAEYFGGNRGMARSIKSITPRALPERSRCCCAHFCSCGECTCASRIARPTTRACGHAFCLLTALQAEIANMYPRVGFSSKSLE